MDFSRRKLAEVPSICELLCPKDGSANCTTSCSVLCPSYRCVSPDPIVPPSPPNPPSPSSNSSHKSSAFLIVVMVILGASFLFLCCYGFYVRYVSNSRRTNSASQSGHQTHDRDDQEHGPTVNHPMTTIRTIGPQLSMINSITAFKYKKGDGLVQVMDCSVCLNEFEEGESLRLLPNCSHAFHIPCIDSWLKSHTNCPMCRAPIVINSETKTSLPEPTSVN